MKNCWKKIAALFCAAAMMFSFTACALEDPEQTSSEESSGSESSKEEVSQISDEDAEDSLKGLVLYLDAKGYLSENSVEMSASMIGAESGLKYSVSLNGTDNITIELYEFDLENLNDEAQAIIESVKKDGTFTVAGMQASGAMMSNSGKYMMIYTDTVENEENTARAEKVKEDFAGFKN